MTIDEFLRRVSHQTEVEQTREVRVWGPTLRAAFESGRVTVLSEIFAHPDQTTELRAFRHGHLIGAGLSPEEISAWQAQHPDHPLPQDLTELLERASGIHLWADLDVGRAYFGILPLSEWEDVASLWWVGHFREPPVGKLAISYHGNSDFYLSLDTRTSEYSWHDMGDADSARLVGVTVPEFLDWYWHEAQELDPRM